MERGNSSEPETLEHTMMDMLSYDIHFVKY